MNKVHVKTGDTVVLLTGKYEYKYTDKKDRRTGKVLEVSPKEGKVIVEGFNMITKHVKPRGAQKPGGITKMEGPIDASNVMVVCPKCSKATRVGHQILANGDKIRVCKKCGDSL